MEYTAEYTDNVPYQLVLRTRIVDDANFRLTVLDNKRDTIFFKDINLSSHFKKLGMANENSNWLISNFALTELWGSYILRFDWYDKIAEPGIFGAFSFTESILDIVPPQWYFVSIGTISKGTEIIVMTNEAATVYLVPEGTSPDINSIASAAFASTEVGAYSQSKFATSDLPPGNYVVYAVDSSNNISEPSRLITIQTPVGTFSHPTNQEIHVTYNSKSETINIESSCELGQVNIYNILGRKIANNTVKLNSFKLNVNSFLPGIYLVNVNDKNKNVKNVKIYIE